MMTLREIELADAFVFGGAGVQQSRLEAEGVEVKDGRVDLEKYAISSAKIETVHPGC